MIPSRGLTVLRALAEVDTGGGIAIGEPECDRMADLAGLTVQETLACMPNLHRDRFVGKGVELHPSPPSAYALSRLRWWITPEGRERASWLDVPELIDAEVATREMIETRGRLRARALS